MKDLKDLINYIKNIFRGRKSLLESKFVIDTLPKIYNISSIHLSKAHAHLGRAIRNNKVEEKLVDGITEEESETILKWVLGNTREALGKDSIRKGEENLQDASMQGACGHSQAIIGTQLKDLLLETSTNNVHSSIAEGVSHAYSVAIFPIKNVNKVFYKPYLIDATFRQFFQRYWQEHPFASYNRFLPPYNDTPRAGYFLSLTKEGRAFSETLLRDGFIELNERNAKIYGDAFVLETRGVEYYGKLPTQKDFKVDILGEEYMREMLSNKEELDIDSRDELQERGEIFTIPRKIDVSVILEEQIESKEKKITEPERN